MDVNANIDGRLPLHYASDYGQLEVIKYLCQKVRSSTVDLTWLSWSVLQGAKVNAEDKHGISPLLAAVWEGHTSCVKFLLEKVPNKKTHSQPENNSIISGSCQGWQDS